MACITGIGQSTICRSSLKVFNHNWLNHKSVACPRSFSTSSTANTAERCYKLVVVGGGTAGCAMASKFTASLGHGKVAVVEPSETHYYQSLFTMVGAGLRRLDQTHYPMQAVLPKHCVWVQDSATEFDPDNCTVTTSNGTVLKYDFLVVAMGLQLNYHQIKGCTDALDSDPAVCSIYSPKYVKKVRTAVDSLSSGNAIFTFPNTGIKCAGAAQKICYLSEEIISKKGMRNKVKFIYNTAPGVIFTNPYYAAALEKLADSRNIHWNKLRNLIEIRSEKKEAIFEIMENGCSTGKTEIFKYSMLHIAPPMSTPSQLWKTPLVDKTNFVDVNKSTLQHTKYKNVFALGDCANTPTSKTAAACASQVSVASKNLQMAIDGKDPEKKYDGYTSCPLLVNHNKVMLAEFGYDGVILETFPVDQRIPRRSMFYVKAHMMPHIYWKLMIRGLWHGPSFFRKIWRFGL
jgi:NADH dehydrogenase FAD-containing subunit